MSIGTPIEVKRYPVPENWSVEKIKGSTRILEEFSMNDWVGIPIPRMWEFINICHGNILLIRNFQICPQN